MPNEVSARPESSPPVLLIGGGRWSRVLLPVLRSVLPAESQIHWITQHNQAAARDWLHENPLQRVEILSGAQWHYSYGVAVVATSPSTHYAWLTELLGRSIPTFCEKPLTLDVQQAMHAVSLSSANDVPLGVNLELHYASYLEQFVQQVVGRRCNRIAIDWLDPWSEQRYGELKQGDVTTDIVHDMWPHCWSILRLILPQQPIQSIERVQYDPLDGVRIIALHKQCRSEVRLTRRHHQRKRCLRFNDQEAVLNFSQEPGTTLIDGTLSDNQWLGQRPLSRALQSFFAVALGGSTLAAWPLAASNCLDSIRWAQEIAASVAHQQRMAIEQIGNSGMNLEQLAHRNLLIDTYVPKYAQHGLRLKVLTTEQQIDAARQICLTEHILMTNAPDVVT